MNKLQSWLNINKSKLSKQDFDLVKKASTILRSNVCEGSEYPWHPFRCIQPFGNCTIKDGGVGIWNWDSAFHSIGVSHWDIELAKEQILGFIQYQLDNGMYIDVKWANGSVADRSSKPPVLAWATAELFKNDNDIEFVKKTYPSLVKNIQFWENERFYNGLFHYSADADKTPIDLLDLYTRYESGWDDSVRWDNPCAEYWAIDLNCYLIMSYRGLITLANALEKKSDAEAFEKKEKLLIKNINGYLWNDITKTYTDTNRFTGERSNITTPASFMPLYVNIATSERAIFMSKLAYDKNKFYPGMPTVSYDDPEYSQRYWRGNTWLNVAYFAAKGLKNYGFNDVANDVKKTILTWVANDGEFVHENYNSTTGKGLFCPKFSWSCVFVLEFIFNF